MLWNVELTEECEAWWNTLTEAEQESVGHGFDLLAELGPALSRPYADTLKGSRYPNLKELRVQHEGRPYRVLYALIHGVRRFFCSEAINGRQPVVRQSHTAGRNDLYEAPGDTGMKSWTDVRGKMAPESRARMDIRLQEALTSMPLDKLRKARRLTQTAVAERLKVDQGSVSKLESRTDMYLSTLREYVEALGGTLELRADFPDGSINIDLHAS